MNLIFNAHSLEEYPQWKLQEFKPFIAQSTTFVIDLYMLQEAHLMTSLHAQQPPIVILVTQTWPNKLTVAWSLK